MCFQVDGFSQLTKSVATSTLQGTFKDHVRWGGFKGPRILSPILFDRGYNYGSHFSQHLNHFDEN